MAKSSNASPTVFGFDFQVNATIFLLLDNIEKLKAARMEGASEDIELTFNDGKQIMAQAKGIVKGSTDFSHVREKLKDGLTTLTAADNGSVEQLIFITNSTNPLNEETSKSFFYGPPARVGYKNLSEEAQNVINGIVDKIGVDFDASKFYIYSFRFETSDDKERYKVIEERIGEFLNRLGLGRKVSSEELMTVWQNDILHNGAKTDISITVNKQQIIWPVIVLAIGKQMPTEYIEEYDQGLVDEITTQYSEIINNSVERYETITKILYDFRKTPFEGTLKSRVKEFINKNWSQYVEILSLNSLNSEIQEAVSKIILAKVISERYTMDEIKNKVAL